MAKDGTNRGGRRTRSGPNKDPLAEKVMKGRPANVMRFTFEDITNNDPDVADLEGVEMPKPSEYLSAMQRAVRDSKTKQVLLESRPLGADLIFDEIYKWLRARKCDKLINPRQVEQYSELLARAIQCSEAISTFGLLGKHPTTNAPMPSPYIDAELKYMKQANVVWNEIFRIVEQNNLTPYEGMPTSDDMEQLIFGRKPKW